MDAVIFLAAQTQLPCRGLPRADPQQCYRSPKLREYRVCGAQPSSDTGASRSCVRPSGAAALAGHGQQSRGEGQFGLGELCCTLQLLTEGEGDQVADLDKQKGPDREVE